MHRDPIMPHGGQLVTRMVVEAERERFLERARAMPQVPLDRRAQSDLELIAVGALSPLRGFLCAADYRNVIENSRLADGVPWTIPICLQVRKEIASDLREGSPIALTDDRGDILAVMDLAEKYSPDLEREAERVYRTTDRAHPGVAKLIEAGDCYLGGEVHVVRTPISHSFPSYDRDPAQTRAIFRERKWRNVVGFQTRNPMHRAHEYITKCALEIADGLLVHPLIGDAQPDDVPADVRLRCYEVLIQNYYPADRVLLSTFPGAMRYAGPREAVHHAIIRKNYGCTHFIVGRDHAGIGKYYGAYDAQSIFDDFEQAELGIIPLKFENAFYSRVSNGIATSKTAPSGGEVQIPQSGTALREALRRGEPPPFELTRPEIAQILVESFKGARA